jgi:hypothetical protein
MLEKVNNTSEAKIKKRARILTFTDEPHCVAVLRRIVAHLAQAKLLGGGGAHAVEGGVGVFGNGLVAKPYQTWGQSPYG